jgi:hypothetical protein
MKLSLSFSTNLEKTSRMALEISSNSSAMHLENAVHLSIYLSVLRREMRERERTKTKKKLSPLPQQFSIIPALKNSQSNPLLLLLLLLHISKQTNTFDKRKK